MAKITPKIRTLLLLLFLTGSYISTYANYTSSFLNFLDIEYEADIIIFPTRLEIAKIPTLKEILKSSNTFDNTENIIAQLFTNYSLKSRIQNNLFKQKFSNSYFKFSTYLFSSFSIAPCDNDTEVPVIAPVSPLTQDTDTDRCSATVSISVPSASDNCNPGTAIGVRNDSQLLNAAYPKGLTTITWSYNDGNGNDALTVEQTVTIEDNEPPEITNNGDQNLNTDPTVCGASFTASATATDNCSVGNPTGARSDGAALGAVFPVGSTTINWNVTDANGIDATPVVQTINVTDNEAPVITNNGDQNLNTDPTVCGASFTVSATATDNCSVGNPTGARSDGAALGAVFPVGSTTINWNVTDANGIDATPVIQTINVTDNEAPVITHNGDQNLNTDPTVCGASFTASATTTDNCSVGNPTGARSDGAALGAVFPVGSTTINWNVTDANGIDATPVIQTINVTDNEAPVITHNGDQNLNTDPTVCGASFTVSATATDNCSVGNPTGARSDGAALGAVFPVGSTTINWNVTDANGIDATPVVQTINVTDNEAPVITHNGDQNLNTDPTVCGASFTVSATTTDNCSVGNPTGARSDGAALGAVFPVGSTTINWNVTDANGIDATPVVQTINVTDNEPPVITAPAEKMVDADTDKCTASGVALGNPSTNDNCGVKNVSNDAPTIFPLGITTVTWTVTDNSDNTQTATQIVTVNDRQPPTRPVLPDLYGECPLTVVPPTTTDNCGEIITATTGISNLTFSESETIFWIFTDASGNPTQPVEQKITVTDTSAPVPDVAALPKKTFNGCQISSIDELTIPTATDACEGRVYGSLGEAFQFPFIFGGTKTIEWEFPDSKGNKAIQSQEIEITPVTIDGGTLSATYDSENYQDRIDITACGGSISVQLNLAGEVGDIIQWEKLADNDEAWVAIGNQNDYYNATFTVGALESTYFRVLTQEGTCIQYSNSFYIRALPEVPAPTVENLGDSSYYCLGDNVNLLATSNYVVTQETITDQGGDFSHGQINPNDPDSWLVDGEKGGFSFGGNSTKPKNWSGTNANHDWGGIEYLSEDGKFAIAYGNQNSSAYPKKAFSPTTLETPILDFSNARTASINFDQAFYFSQNDVALIEVSIDGGDTYTTLRVMHGLGNPVKNWFTAGSAESVVGSSATQYNFDTDNTTISLDNYTGENFSRVRIRWSFKGTSDKSAWALDNIFVNKEVLVNTDLEWTVGIGDPDEDPIDVGRTEIELNFIPASPGHHQYGGTSLINDCRTYDEEGTGLIDIYVSYSYAGENIILTDAECGQNIVQLNAYDNTKTANENAEKEAYPLKPENCTTCDHPGTGDIGTWSWSREGTTISCIPESFSDVNDPNATFTGGAGTYTLTWTVNGCSHNIIVTITDCDQVDFDGTNDYVDFGEDSYNLSGTDNKKAFSIEVWVKPEIKNGRQTIFSKRDANLSSNLKGYDLRIDDGEVSFNWDNNGSIKSSPYKIDVNRWYHIALTHSSDGEYNLYIDGVFIKRVGGGSPGKNSYKAILGAMYNNGSSPLNYFNGWMEEIRIWKVALTPDQLHLMMNQHIKKVGTEVEGEVIPLKIKNLKWDDLIGYYRMDETGCGYVLPYFDGVSYVGFNGRLNNITSPQNKTAPLPYESETNGNWRDRNTWDQNIGGSEDKYWSWPNETGINGEEINWNIAIQNHDIKSNNKDIKLLGLFSETGSQLIMDGVNSNSGNELRITHYLELNGHIDLHGESQLVQTEGSILEESSSGYIERSQQGTASSFNYNYWSSPVVTQGNDNNSTYIVASVMMDGSAGTNYGNLLNFNDWYEYSDYTYPDDAPRRISNYWINKFHDSSNVYSKWERVGSTGTLLAGEGYTMKGTSGFATISTPQNYVFKGKPNNGNISLTIGQDQNFLLGNPYPSALDADQFIKDNLMNGGTNPDGNIFNGALYFWDHFAGKTHILTEYIGGYATYNLMGGLAAASTDERINANDSIGTKKPGQFIPVGQGFFINTVLDPSLSPSITVDGGNVIFKNSQRAFIKETDPVDSQFLRPEKNIQKNKQADTRSKIRLDFNSPMGYNRQILVGSDPNTTNGYDLGYDAQLNDNNLEDMFWLINNIEFVIQGVPNFGIKQILPLGIKINEAGVFNIKINKLENVGEDVNIYLKNLQDSTYFDLRKGDFSMHLDPGTYNERFQIVFQIQKVPTEEPVPVPEEEAVEEEQEAADDEEILAGEIEVFYVGNYREIAVLNPSKFKIERIVIYDMLGQIIQEYQNIPNEKEVKLPVREFPAAVYAIKLYSGNKEISKSIILIR